MDLGQIESFAKEVDSDEHVEYTLAEIRENLDALDRRVPYLGICFGAQVLAWSLDNAIEKAPALHGLLPIALSMAVALDPRVKGIPSTKGAL